MADEICFEAPEINMASEWVIFSYINYNILLYNTIKSFFITGASEIPTRNPGFQDLGPKFKDQK